VEEVFSESSILIESVFDFEKGAHRQD